MVIDARKMELHELFMKLKNFFHDRCGQELNVDVMIDTYHNAKRIAAFSSMSGCRTNIEKKEGYYFVHITGSACCV